jgi:F-type H+-transporting ATPase subunit alpha
LEAFAKFGSDLDAATKSVIDKGARNVEILKQAQNNPYTVEEQCAIIFAGTNGLIMDVPVNKVKQFESDYLAVLKASHSDVLVALKAGKLTDEVVETLRKVTKEVSSKFA